MIQGRPRPARPGHADALFYRTSSYSGGGNCVEVGLRSDGGVVVLDTKDPHRALVLSFDPAEWRAFLDQVKAGVHDT